MYLDDQPRVASHPATRMMEKGEILHIAGLAMCPDGPLWLHKKQHLHPAVLTELEPAQAKLWGRICAGPTITSEQPRVAGALDVPAETKRGQEVSWARPF